MIIRITNSKSKIILNKKKKRFDDFSSIFSYKNISEKNLIIWRPKLTLESGLKKFIESRKNN